MSLHLSFLLTYAPSVFAPRWPQVGVHIADVTHFVRPGTALDEEAAKRGTTVYLADRRHVWLSLLAHLFCVVFGVGLCIVEQQLTSSPPTRLVCLSVTPPSAPCTPAGLTWCLAC